MIFNTARRQALVVLIARVVYNLIAVIAVGRAHADTLRTTK